MILAVAVDAGVDVDDDDDDDDDDDAGGAGDDAGGGDEFLGAGPQWLWFAVCFSHEICCLLRNGIHRRP